MLFCIVPADIQQQKLRGTEAQIDERIHIVRIGRFADLLADFLYLDIVKGIPVRSLIPAYDEVRGKVEVFRDGLTRYAVFINQAAEGLHVLLGAFSLPAGIQALLQIVHVDIRHGKEPDGFKVLERGLVAVHRGLPCTVCGQPLLVKLLEGDRPLLLFHRLIENPWQSGNGLLLGGKHLAMCLSVPFSVVGHEISDSNDSFILPGGKLEHRALAVAAGFFLFLAELLLAAETAKDTALRQVSSAFVTVHFP